jgi:hypothetical protein
LDDKVSNQRDFIDDDDVDDDDWYHGTMVSGSRAPRPTTTRASPA